MPDPDARYHYRAPNIDAHYAAFREQPPDEQARHLRIAHHLRDLPADLAWLTEHQGRQATYSDSHEWWHIRQRRSMMIGDGLEDGAQ